MTEELAEIFIKNKILPLGGLKTGLKALEISNKCFLSSMQVERTKVLLNKIFSVVGVIRPSEVNEKLWAVVSIFISVKSKVEYAPEPGSFKTSSRQRLY